jgi:hypothetical protein
MGWDTFLRGKMEGSDNSDKKGGHWLRLTIYLFNATTELGVGAYYLIQTNSEYYNLMMTLKSKPWSATEILLGLPVLHPYLRRDIMSLGQDEVGMYLILKNSKDMLWRAGEVTVSHFSDSLAIICMEYSEHDAYSKARA